MIDSAFWLQTTLRGVAGGRPCRRPCSSPTRLLPCGAALRCAAGTHGLTGSCAHGLTRAHTHTCPHTFSLTSAHMHTRPHVFMLTALTHTSSFCSRSHALTRTHPQPRHAHTCLNTHTHPHVFTLRAHTHPQLFHTHTRPTFSRSHVLTRTRPHPDLHVLTHAYTHTRPQLFHTRVLTHTPTCLCSHVLTLTPSPFTLTPPRHTYLLTHLSSPLPPRVHAHKPHMHMCILKFSHSHILGFMLIHDHSHSFTLSVRTHNALKCSHSYTLTLTCLHTHSHLQV